MERTEQTTLQLNAIRLCRTWLDFLDHAGRYAARYYLARDLELPPGLQSPNTRIILARNYQTEKKLLEAIQRDLDTFPAELQDINAAQTACDLLPFSERADYLAQIVMGFAMLDRHGKERRGYYRRKVNQALKASGKREVDVEPLSLNQLEKSFQESQRRAEIRHAKKIALANAAAEAAYANTYGTAVAAG